ncbi:MAG: hypothetical protein AAF222_02325, partial [Pseudomonadota bacterium]
VTDNRPGSPDGTDTITNVELFRFSDGDVTPAEALNEGPSMTASGGAVAENDDGAVVGAVSATDPDAGDTVTLTVDDARFEVVGGQLKLKDGESLDYEADGATVSVTVTATDVHGATDTQVVTVTVGDEAEDIRLGDGGERFDDTSTTETSITGGTGDDTITGTDGDSDVDGGDGNDVVGGDAGENLIVNGSFEDIDGAAIDSVRAVMTSVDGWTDANGSEFEMHVDGYSGADAADGDYWLDMSGRGDRMDIGQTVSAMQDGESYELSFDAGNYTGRLVGELEVYFGGALIATIDPDTPDQMDTYTFDLIGGSGDGSNTLRFVEVGSSHNVGVALDNVRLVAAGDDTLTGGAGNDTVSGGAGDDSIEGGAGNDLIDGGSGNDTILAGDGNDALDGGSDDDTLEGDTGDDLVDGGAGNDTAVFTGVLADYDVSYDAGTETFTITDLNAADGDDGTDTVTGVEEFLFEGTRYTAADLVTVAGSGSGDGSAISDGDNDDTPDTTTAGSDATHVGTSGNDSFWTTGHDDVVYGLDGNDTIGGDAGDDRVDGGAGNDDLHGNDGNDTLYGGSGNDTVFAHTGDDEVYGDAGNDVLYGIEGDDTVYGGSGNDTVYGGGENDLLYGDLGGDLVYGEDGSDTLSGGSGSDTLHGGDGDDHLLGGVGDDTLVGDDGNDTFYFSTMDGHDQVQGGWAAGWTDVISIEGVNGAGATQDGNTVEGNGWTLVLESGSTVTSLSLDSIELSPDAAGSITFDDGGIIDFTTVERIEF